MTSGSTVASALATARRIPSLCLAASLPALLLRPNELLGDLALMGDAVYLPKEFRRATSGLPKEFRRCM